MIDFSNIIIKNIFLNIYSIMMFFKLSKHSKINFGRKIIIFLSILVYSFIYTSLKNNFDIVMASLLIYLLQVVLLKIITKKNTSSILIGVIISMSLSYILFTISVSLEFIFQKMFNICYKTVNLLLTLIIELLLIHFILKLKRLKNGLTFLNKTNEYVEIVIINICILVIIIYGLLGYSDEKVFEHLLLYFIVVIICMIITIQKILVMYYKQKLIDDTIKQYKKDLQEKDNEIKRLTDEAFKISKINHEFYNRQKSLELMVKEKLQILNTEAASEIDVLNRINELTSEHSNKVKELKSLPKLPLTDISEIDDMFSYMCKECDKSNIQFKLNINGNIHFLINNIIPKNKLETLIGDHIRDAIIAINSSNNIFKQIFVILGVCDDKYELCIYDTGIEFEIQTLLKLGLSPITTHKDTGGSGIGFMTTFETLKECKASLIIEELRPVDDKDYTKAVKVRFDGKNEYKICSYRAEQIIKECKDNRIIINYLDK